ncbi:MAG: glycosyltransferase family 2 protein [Bacteroidaceae bacterium]|nr:glycosyltransferase family 2 protein [Bacteroidaceae bacterium]
MYLSIVIPHYNLPQALLKRCLDSILAIELPAEEYEIIVVDDGSDTPPRWINETYTTGNIKLIESEHNCQGAARNIGIDAARGRYIQFVDADDTLQCNNAIPQCIEKLKQEHPDVLRFKYRVCPKYKAPSKKSEQQVTFGNTISGAVYMAGNNLPANVWCYFVRTELLRKKEIRFTHGIFHEDEEFSTILHYHAQTLVECDANIYNYCIRQRSTTTARSAANVEKRLADRMTVLERLATFRATTSTQSNSIQRKALQRKLTTLVVDTIVNNLRAGKSAKQTHNLCTSRITPLMLYPIAEGDYGFKFKIFRKLANSKTGLYLLRLIVPSTQKPAKQ